VLRGVDKGGAVSRWSRVVGFLVLACAIPAIGTLSPLDVGAEPPDSSAATSARVTPSPMREPRPLRVRIETPDDGAVVASADADVFVAGRVLTPSGELDVFDLVIVIDRSKSTDAPTGVDIDGDGYVGRAPESRYADGSSDDQGDSVLAAEVVAARTLIEQLDPETTRVAVVAFSGDTDPETPDASVLSALSNDYSEANRVLDEVLDDWPSGRTHLAAAIHTATAELLGLGATPSSPRPEAKKIILLMTDGQPTLPVPFAPGENAEASFRAARLAARGGIRIDSFAIGRDANEDPEVTRAISALTHGEFTGVLEPRDLVSTFESLRLASVRAVEALNRTTGAVSDAVMLEPDGRFSALVALAPGENVLEIRAQGETGRWTHRTLKLRLVAGAAAPPLHARWLERRSRLLEARLMQLRRRQVELEIELFGDAAYPGGRPLDPPRPGEPDAERAGGQLEIEITTVEEPSSVPASPAP